jgi:hypothetical protein
MDLREEFKKETGLRTIVEDGNGNSFYTEDYVAWLESQIQALRIHNAVERSERFGNVQKSDDPPNNDRPDWNGNCWNQI